MPSLQRQYHGCWWHGDARSQGICNHNIDQDNWVPAREGLMVPYRRCGKDDVVQTKNEFCMGTVIQSEFSMANES